MDELPHTLERERTIRELAVVVSSCTLVGDACAPVTGIQYDSRLVRPGDLFAALPGADFDGHSYIEAAIANGATALLTERQFDGNLPQIVTPDSRAALAQISAEFFGHPSRELHVIGLTGTDGKTTTSFLIDHILRQAGLVTGLIGTIGIRIGADIRYALPHQTTPESNLLQGYLREMVENNVPISDCGSNLAWSCDASARQHARRNCRCHKHDSRAS